MSSLAATLSAGPKQANSAFRRNLNTICIIWYRVVLRFVRDWTRIITSLAQPLMFLFVFGYGLSGSFNMLGAAQSQLPPGTPSINFTTFLFPGVLSMTVLFTAIFSAISIVWDREFGFLREMLVAPVRRGALVAGKCAGGATVATLQALIMLVLCGLVGVPYSPVLLLTLAGEMLLAAVAVTALGTALASRMAQVESFQVVMQFVVLPLFFLSGALFPLRALPAWLSVLTRLDPLAYVVDPMRRAVFAHVHTTPAVTRVFGATMTWGSYHLPIWLELLLTAAFALLMLVLAVANFSKSD